MDVEKIHSAFLAQIPAFSGAGLRVARVVEPSVSSLHVSGSKSFTNRAIVLAGMNSEVLELSGVLFSDDSYWGFLCLQRLGFELEFNILRNQVRISPPTKLSKLDSPLYLGMAGTLARFFPAVILNFQKSFPALFAASNKKTAEGSELSVQLSGEKRLCERPLAELVYSLRSLGALISSEHLPLQIKSGQLSGNCQISGSKSGQFLSGILLAAAGSREPIIIERTENLVQPDYVRMTLAALTHFGAQLDYNAELTRFRAFCPKGIFAKSYAIEADASTACYFMAFAFLHGIDVTLLNLGSDSLQPDLGFAVFLRRMGAKIEISKAQTSIQGSASRGLVPKGGFHADFSALSDQSLTAAAVALFCDGPIEISGVGHIRTHESDRIAGLIANLSKLGVNAKETSDGFMIIPLKKENQIKMSGLWNTFYDHRFAMTGFLVASLCPGVEVQNPSCVEKTSPNFFIEFAKLGAIYL